jgi:hypothetical protein
METITVVSGDTNNSPVPDVLGLWVGAYLEGGSAL